MKLRAPVDMLVAFRQALKPKGQMKLRVPVDMLVASRQASKPKGLQINLPRQWRLRGKTDWNYLSFQLHISRDSLAITSCLQSIQCPYSRTIAMAFTSNHYCAKQCGLINSQSFYTGKKLEFKKHIHEGL